MTLFPSKLILIKFSKNPYFKNYTGNISITVPIIELTIPKIVSNDVAVP